MLLAARLLVVLNGMRTHMACACECGVAWAAGWAFGAPETVPAGKIERNASKRVLSLCSVPDTFETMCITWE